MALSAGQFAWMSETTRILITRVSREGRPGMIRAPDASRRNPGSGSSQPSIVPELEHQQRPEGFAMVAYPRLMLADPPRDLLGAEQALPLEPTGIEQPLEQRRQRPAEPAGDG